MIKDIIGNIRKAEERARDIEVSSKKEYKKIVEDAYRESDKILEKAKKEVELMIPGAENKAKEEAAAEAENMKKDYDRRHREIEKIFKSKREKAIGEITQRILGNVSR